MVSGSENLYENFKHLTFDELVFSSRRFKMQFDIYLYLKAHNIFGTVCKNVDHSALATIFIS